MLLNLAFANNTTLSYFFFLFLNYWLIIFDSCSYCISLINPIAELVVPTGVPIKEVKAEIEIHSVIVEAKIRKCSI